MNIGILIVFFVISGKIAVSLRFDGSTGDCIWYLYFDMVNYKVKIEDKIMLCEFESQTCYHQENKLYYSVQ